MMADDLQMTRMRSVRMMGHVILGALYRVLLMGWCRVFLISCEWVGLMRRDSLVHDSSEGFEGTWDIHLAI